MQQAARRGAIGLRGFYEKLKLMWIAELAPYRLSCAEMQRWEAQKAFRNTRARDSRVNGEGRKQLPGLMMLEWAFNKI
jgi:hypothetical protein